MTDKKDSGGLAFPVSVAMPDGSVAVERGMSLRDYFAAKAMQALVAPMIGMSNEDFDHHLSVTHMVAYKIADAMLAERAK